MATPTYILEYIHYSPYFPQNLHSRHFFGEINLRKQTRGGAIGNVQHVNWTSISDPGEEEFEDRSFIRPVVAILEYDGFNKRKYDNRSVILVVELIL